jgi:hypothetical protein
MAAAFAQELIMRPKVPSRAPLQAGHGAVWLYPGLLIAVSLHFAIAYTTATIFPQNIGDYIAGHGLLPFQYRALAAWILRLILHLPLAALCAHLPPPVSDPNRMAVLILAFFCQMGIIEITRRTLREYLDDRFWCGVLAFSVAWGCYFSYAVLASIWRVAMPYDLLVAFLASLSLLFAVRNQIIPFLAVFACASLAKETAVISLIIFMCYRNRGVLEMVRRDWLILAAAAVLWISAKVVLYRLYGHNPAHVDSPDWLNARLGLLEVQSHLGGAFMFELGPNLRNIINPVYWAGLASSVGWLWIVVVFGWKYLPVAPLRRAILIATPTYLGVMMLVGRITEVRIFGELLPLFSVAASIILYGFLRATFGALPPEIEGIRAE